MIQVAGLAEQIITIYIKKKKKVLNLNYLLFHIYYGGSPHLVSHSNSLNQQFIYLTKGDGF